MPVKQPLNQYILELGFLEAGLETSLEAGPGTDPGPDPGPDPVQEPQSQIPDSQILVYY